MSDLVLTNDQIDSQLDIPGAASQSGTFVSSFSPDVTVQVDHYVGPEGSGYAVTVYAYGQAKCVNVGPEVSRNIPWTVVPQ